MFVADLLVHHLAGARIEHDLVGGDLAADQGLAQPPGRVDDEAVAAAGHRVGGKEHTGGIGGNEPLDDDSHLHGVLGCCAGRPFSWL